MEDNVGDNECGNNLLHNSMNGMMIEIIGMPAAKYSQRKEMRNQFHEWWSPNNVNDDDWVMNK